MKTTNYINTFIEVADDCPVKVAEVPPSKENKKTVANLQFELIKSNPYKYTSDDVIFSIHAIKNDLTEKEFSKQREIFFSKGQACFRSSPLPKRYGWGVHSDSEGKIAIYGIDSKEYDDLIKNKDVKHLKAMRSKRV